MMINTDNAVRPISQDDAFIEKALEDVNIPTLMMSIIHLTGDASLLDDDIRPRRLEEALDANGGLTDEQKQRVRQMALEALKQYRDNGCPALAPLDPGTIRRMTGFVVGETVPDEYLPMMYQEMRIDVNQARPDAWSDAAMKARKNGFHVLIVGSGMAGILAAVKLQEIGVPYTIIEKADDIGGTWRDNTYPGCRVDLPSHVYSYSFATNPDWSHHFPVRDDLIPYFKAVAEKFDIVKNVRFGLEVEEACWSEEDKSWHVRVRNRDGGTQWLVGNALISAVGQLSRPKLPEIPGRDSFKGPSCHTHGYDRDMLVDGKRIAVVGTAASAVQLVPELAKTAAQVKVFQRTPHWYWPIPDYHEAVDDGVKWALSHIPFYASWYRFVLFWGLTDGRRHWWQIDPNWPHQDRSVSAINDQHRIQFTDFIKEQVGNDPDLVSKLIPEYPPFADRILLNNGNYLQALTKDHVDLVASGITAIDETGIVDGEGNHYDVDAIVYATGFHSTKYLFPMRIVGKDGLTLNDFWDGEGRGYLGVTVPNFPNFFMMWGPGTSGGTGGSNIFFAECHMRYIRSAIQQMIEAGVDSIECRNDVFDAYVDRFRAEVDTMVWTSPKVTSWYKNERGRVVSNMPFRLIDYWTLTRQADLSDYVLDDNDLSADERERIVA